MPEPDIQLLLVDPQHDFCDLPGAALPVAGADADLRRAAALMGRCGHLFSDIHVTLDSHSPLDIAHPCWWRDGEGRHPEPFTVIGEADLTAGRWQAADAAQAAASLAYVRALAERGRHQLVVWPEHCLVGTPGHNIHPAVMQAIGAWGRSRLRAPRYIWKGLSPTTEHYSALRAEVPDPADPRTLPDRGWLARLAQADTLLIAGEALSHCVANTVRDLVELLGADSARKMVLLEDCSSTIAGFEDLSTRFLADMARLGMQVRRSDTLYA